MIDYAAQITRAQFAVQDKIGQVLSSGSRLLAVKDRAEHFLRTPNAAVNEKAAAITAKTNGLVANLQLIQNDALRLGGEANRLLSEIQADPTWKQIQSNPTFMDYAGAAVRAVAGSNIGRATSLTQQLVSLAGRADEHLRQVSQLERDEADMENFAQGKGIAAKISGIGGFFGGVIEKETTILSVGAVLVLGFMGWQLLAPARAAAAVHRNPRRRRR